MQRNILTVLKMKDGLFQSAAHFVSTSNKRKFCTDISWKEKQLEKSLVQNKFML